MLDVNAIAARDIAKQLEEWLGEWVHVEAATRRDGLEFDFVGKTGDRTFAFAVKSRDDIASLERAKQQLQSSDRFDSAAIAVLVVPFMGPKAREWLNERGMSWFDLSGNADIRAPGLRILVEGRPNRFASPGRPSTAFSHKSARLARVMLVEPNRWWRQQELAQLTGLSAGYVSKVVARLREDGLLDDITGTSGVRPKSPDVLLDAWAQVDDFRQHDITRYHAVGRSGPAIAMGLATRLKEQPELEWAATGLAAAWPMRRFADYRLVTLYVSTLPSDIASLGLRRVDGGENVWLVVPKDAGVFHGAEEVEGLRCVHPVQAWLDLLGHPERAKEAAADIREHQLPWSRP